MNTKISVCIDAVLEGVPLEQALAMVAECGYGAFEFWCWWQKDLDGLLSARDRYGLKIAACCTKFISLIDPSLRSEYLRGLEESIAVAQRLGCPTLISQVGDFRPGIAREEQHACLVAGLREAARLLSGSGVRLAIEPLNDRIDHPGYYLVHSDEAFEIIEKVASPDVQVTFDLYHQQISEGHLIARLTENIDKIAHFHAAGNPGRHELDQGELHYPSILAAIERTGYSGYIGLEYWPLQPAEQGLRDVASW